MLGAVPDWSSGAVGGVLIVFVLLLYVRARKAAGIGPRSTPEEIDADVERDLELERLNNRPRI